MSGSPKILDNKKWILFSFFPRTTCADHSLRTAAVKHFELHHCMNCAIQIDCLALPTWLNMNPPISAFSPAEPIFLLLWNSFCTTDLNVAQDNSMQFPWEEHSRSLVLLLCVFVEAYDVYHILIGIGGFKVNPWVRVTCAYWANMLSSYWLWLLLPPKIHLRNCFASTRYISIRQYWFFCDIESNAELFKNNHTHPPKGAALIPQAQVSVWSSGGAAGRQVPCTQGHLETFDWLCFHKK